MSPSRPLVAATRRVDQARAITTQLWTPPFSLSLSARSPCLTYGCGPQQRVNCSDIFCKLNDNHLLSTIWPAFHAQLPSLVKRVILERPKLLGPIPFSFLWRWDWSTSLFSWLGQKVCALVRAHPFLFYCPCFLLCLSFLLRLSIFFPHWTEDAGGRFRAPNRKTWLGWRYQLKEDPLWGVVTREYIATKWQHGLRAMVCGPASFLSWFCVTARRKGN